MPLDPDIAGFLAAAGAELAFPRGARTEPERARGYLTDVRRRLNAPLPATQPLVDVRDELIPGGPAVRIYRDSAAPGLPVVVYLHGGGWVSGGLEMNDGLCRMLATSIRSVVVSVDYRLAPEYPYPAALFDVLEALQWTRRNAERIGADPTRLSIAGTSAGGNLAAAACLLARELGIDRPQLQVLLYPVLDVPTDTQSYMDHSTGYLLEREQMEWYWDSYLPRRAERIPAYAAPARCDDLCGLPPAVVVAAEYDPLRDEAEAFGERLINSGVPTAAIRCAGMIHGFLSFLEAIPTARTAAAGIARAIVAMRDDANHPI